MYVLQKKCLNALKSRSNVGFYVPFDSQGHIVAGPHDINIVLWLNVNFRTSYRKGKFGEKLDAFDLVNTKMKVFKCLTRI